MKSTNRQAKGSAARTFVYTDFWRRSSDRAPEWRDVHQIWIGVAWENLWSEGVQWERDCERAKRRCIGEEGQGVRCAERKSSQGMGDIKVPPRTYRGGIFGQGQPPGQKIQIFWTWPKNGGCPLNLEKKSLLVHSWRLLIHKSHIECTSPSRSKIQYTCSLPLCK